MEDWLAKAGLHIWSREEPRTSGGPWFRKVWVRPTREARLTALHIADTHAALAQDAVITPQRNSELLRISPSVSVVSWWPPTMIALWFHRCQARAIVHGQPAAAEAFTRGLLAEIDDELLTDAQLRASINVGLDDIELPANDRRQVRDMLEAALREARERRQKQLGWDTP